jgi:hypothetical protein
MSFLWFLQTTNEQHRNPLSDRDTFFSAPPIHKLEKPVLGTVEIETGYAPLVRYSGILWRFKYGGFCSCSLTDGQVVQITGRQGNCLLIELEGGMGE